MNYYLDTEFLEGTQKKMFGGQTKPTIDLISIGIISDDNREYYAISKDFNLREAWNRYQLRINKQYPNGPEYNKEYWIRENVLKPIYKELHDKECFHARQALFRANVYLPEPKYKFTYHNLKKLIKKYGKSNKQIAEEVYNFCSNDYHKGNSLSFEQRKQYPLYDKFKPVFYGYFADYDWVAFCWLFGKMIDLPQGFPMYCKDLKQMSDDVFMDTPLEELPKSLWFMIDYEKTGGQAFINLKKHPDYPKQENEHNALDDARWNKKLFDFLNSL